MWTKKYIDVKKDQLQFPFMENQRQVHIEKHKLAKEKVSREIAALILGYKIKETK